MFSKLDDRKKKKVISLMFIAMGILIVMLAITLLFWDNDEVLKLSKIHLAGDSTGNGEYAFSWNDVGDEAEYKILKYNNVKKKYQLWKTVESSESTDKIKVTTAKEFGKYKVRAKIKVGETKITYSSENELEIKPNFKNVRKYSKLHTIKTIKKKDVELVANAKGKGKISHAQSMCSTGDGYVVVLVDRGNSSGRLEKFDRDGNLIKARKTTYVGHANGCTYNPNNKSIYVMRTYAGRRNKTISVFSGKTLKAKKNTSLGVAPSAVGYDKQMNKYYFTASSRMYVMNENMKDKKTFHRLRCQRSQDVCGYNGVIMSCIWTGGKNSYIDMYLANSGAYIGTISIPLGEIESVCVDDGYLVMLYNGGNIYRTKERLSVPKLF